MDADYYALAQAHMRQQVREAATIQVVLSRLWRSTMSPADLDGSFARFTRLALPLVNAGRTTSEATAQRYFDALKEAAGLPDSVYVPRQPFEVDATETSLRVSGVVAAKKKIADGATFDAALQTAGVSMARAAKRRTLQAGRNRLLDLSEKDRDVSHWARVSDGKPCHFCAMLVSRGPVYAQGSAKFRAHDGCGCSAAPVLKKDRTGGWSPDALALRQLWENGGASDWRNAFSSAVADPTSPVSQVLAG